MIYKGELAIEWDRVKEGRVGYDRSGEDGYRRRILDSKVQLS